MKTSRAINAAGPRRPIPEYPPIDPTLMYPWRRLSDWGFGARGIAALRKAGLRFAEFGRQRFFRGSDLIGVLERQQPAPEGRQETTTP